MASTETNALYQFRSVKLS